MSPDKPHLGVDLALDPELATKVLSGFVADAVASTGLSGVVVGVSGGVDSALSAALAVRGLGPEKVHAVLMPYRDSSPESTEHGRELCASLGIEPEVIDITPMVDAYFNTVAPDADRIRRGNKMARERMSILFDIAKREGALVLGTSNKTEILLGYSTVFGDSASSLNPLGDLYKQQVWALARHLEVPESIVSKKPSADLWPGQSDEDDLGFDYGTADEILFLLFDRGLQPEEVIDGGYPAEIVDRIVELEERYRFKRRMMLIARLSGSAVNLDREIPRD